MMQRPYGPDDVSTPAEPKPRNKRRRRRPPSRSLRGPLLVGIDETSPAEGALHLGDLLVRRDRVNAHLLGVTPAATLPLALVLPAEYETVEVARQQRLLAQIRQRLSQTLGVAAYWSTEARIGHPATVMAEVGRARESAMVVIGLPNSRAPNRTALEDLALQIIRAVDMPVFAVPAHYVRLPRHALVAMDFSPASRRAAHAALAVLGPDGTITLAHVRSGIDFVALGQPGWEAIYNRGVEELFSQLVMELQDVGDLAVESIVLGGDVATALLASARERACDLIAAGTQGVTPLDRHLVGSVSTALLRGADSAVLIAPALEAS